MANLISSLLTTPEDLKKSAVKARKEFIELSVKKEEAASYLENGFEIATELIRKTKLRRPITTQERLERKVWLLFYLLGYPCIKDIDNFYIKSSAIAQDTFSPEAFARDDETVLIGNCRSEEYITRRSITSDITDLADKKGVYSRSIKSHFGSNFKPKIVWLLFTHNIAISKADRELAKQNNVNLVSERELRYFIQIAEHLRGAARYQFLAEFLKNQKIPAMQDRKVPAIRGSLGGKKFYAFVSHPKELLKISFVNHRSLNDPEGAPSYQRLVAKARLKQLSTFITNGGFFPTNILVNFTQTVRFDQISKDEETGVSWGSLYLPDRYRSAWIIDGQHRLYGYSSLPNKYQSQNVVVIAFEKLPKEEEANLFVTINHEQKTVPKTLLDDLEGELKWASDKPTERIGAISSRLIGVLNNDIGEPLYGRVTTQGIQATDITCLTVPALKEGIRRSNLIGKTALKQSTYILGPLCDASDTLTIERARDILNRYFSIIKSSNYRVWNSGRSGYLCTNTGIHAHLMLLASLIEHLHISKKIEPVELSTEDMLVELSPLIDPIIEDLKKRTLHSMEEDFKVQFGSGGPKEYYFRLCSIVKLRHPSFDPSGLKQWEEESSEEKIQTADRRLKEINIIVQLALFEKLRDEHGDEYWEKGVTDKEIKAKAYRKSLDDEGSRLPLEHYLDFIEYKKIIEKKENWPLMKPFFNISEPGEKETARNLSWMDRVNELRRIPAHATAKRSYKSDDFDYIEYIFSKLQDKIPAEIWEKAC